MKVQQLILSLWEQFPSSPSTSSSSLSSTIDNPKRLRPLASKFSSAAVAAVTEVINSPDSKSLNSAVTTKCTSRNLDDSLLQIKSGSTRWNPMPEQIKVLEALYQGGMRTPNPLQIEQITAELGKYGRIEGKNVFYWFQNHKARERQKQKRNTVSLSSLKKEEIMKDQFHDGSCKRKCRSWGCLELDVEEMCGPGDRTLELFPLHPEWKHVSREE